MVSLVTLFALMLTSPDSDPVGDAKRDLRAGPVEFVCDAMRLVNKPRRTLCRGHVVVRRGDWLLCCEQFEGTMDESGQWQRLVCSKNVRARRKDEMMWAQEATFLFTAGSLTLTGKPLLLRGASLLHGERIVIDTKGERAQIERPRGRTLAGPPAILPPLPTGDVPTQCPLPSAPPPR